MYFLGGELGSWRNGPWAIRATVSGTIGFLSIAKSSPGALGQGGRHPSSPKQSHHQTYKGAIWGTGRHLKGAEENYPKVEKPQMRTICQVLKMDRGHSLILNDRKCKLGEKWYLI